MEVEGGVLVLVCCESMTRHTNKMQGQGIPSRNKGRAYESRACRFVFGDFGVSFAATVAGRYTRRGGPRLSVQGEPLIVLMPEP